MCIYIYLIFNIYLGLSPCPATVTTSIFLEDPEPNLQLPLESWEGPPNTYPSVTLSLVGNGEGGYGIAEIFFRFLWGSKNVNGYGYFFLDMFIVLVPFFGFVSYKLPTVDIRNWKIICTSFFVDLFESFALQIFRTSLRTRWLDFFANENTCCRKRSMAKQLTMKIYVLGSPPNQGFQSPPRRTWFFERNLERFPPGKS